MLRVLDQELKLCDGSTRRELLRIGALGIGGLGIGRLGIGPLPFGLPLAAQDSPQSRPTVRTNGTFGRAKSVILFGLTGGVPQHETWDPKPNAPAEIRGSFGVIPSRTPGLLVGELMPRTAEWTHKIAVLRAMVTGDNAHSSSGYQMLTGIPHAPLNRESATPSPPNDWPSVGALIRATRGDAGQLPAAITVPEHIWNDGNFPWPGQDAGFLGRRFDPWLLHCDPQDNQYIVPGLRLPEDVSTVRLDDRRSILEQLNAGLDRLVQHSQVRSYGVDAQKAIDLLSGSKARAAFDLYQEPDSVRDRYGRSRYAQSVLLARRLVEAGVSCLQINWTRIKGYENQGGWDTHAKHAESLKQLLMPMMDQCFSALLEDLDQRGLLDQTLVLWFGEFGHTPKINVNAGRDHWGHAFSVAVAGGGIQGGVVYGTTDRHAAFPLADAVTPKDLIATIFYCLGILPETELRDPLGRPIPVSRGQVIQPIV